jgi:hypothetical protein
MAISSVAANAAASNAQSNAIVAQAQAKAVNQTSLIAEQNKDQQTSNPVQQAPAVRPSVNTQGQPIGTTVNVTA